MKELVCHWGQLESMGSTIVRSTKVTSPSLATKTTVLVLSRWRNNECQLLGILDTFLSILVPMGCTMQRSVLHVDVIKGQTGSLVPRLSPRMNEKSLGRSWE